MYPNHVLGRQAVGTTVSVKNLTLDNITSYKKERVNAANVVLTIVGGYDQSNIEYLLEEHFGSLQKGEAREILLENVPSILPTQEKKRFSGISESAMNIIFQVPGMRDLERSYLHILAKYLGGGMSSRLFQVVREEQGLCYDISVEKGDSLANKCVWGVSIGSFDEKNQEKIIASVEQEFEKVRQGDIDHSLLQTIKEGYVKKFWQDYLEEINDQVNEIDARVGKLQPYSTEERVKIWREAKPEDLTRVAQRVLTGNYVIYSVFAE